MSTLDPTTAADLVDRIVAGDARAEAELIERCGPALRFLSRRFARGDADADDLYQDTLVVALEKIRHGEVREPERLAGFLRALAKNLSIQRYRRRAVDAETANEPAIAIADDPRPGPLGDLLHGERIRRTRRLLDELSQPRDRAVLFRYYIAEHSSAEICSDLGLRSEHFYRVLHRARSRFQQLWEAHSGAHRRLTEVP
ncbi:MAG: sigma-70 family RNA polymerase sigma factor [Acidobacteriota bacterium]